MKKIYILLLAAVMLCVILTGCADTKDTPPPISSATAANTPEASAMPAELSPVSTPEPTPEPVPPVPEYEIELVAKTLRGECYDEQHDDKREVVWVICNRVSDGRFGDSIEAVITAPRQFQGYRPGNVPTANDYEIAREVLTEWYEGGCQPLGKYLFFSAGGNHRNIFRENY